jgi:nitrogen fixation protein FixH
MSTKFHWGHGVTVVLAIFMIFIISFVYKTLAIKEYDHKMVSEHYYKDDLNYPNEMKRLENAHNLKENVKILRNEQGIAVVFPEGFEPTGITGTLELQRTNDSSLDINDSLHLTSLQYFIPKDKLKKGVYNVKIIWSYQDIPFQFNEKFVY